MAVKRGWVRKERAAGFTPKPDAFGLDTLPSANAAPSAAPTTPTAKTPKKK